jgi:hypothetical protein
MRNVLMMPAIFLCLLQGYAQNSTVNYTASSAVISNPERGFYKYTDTNSSSYNLINQNTLVNYRNNQNITLIFRYFYLESFVNSDISQSYLNNMQTDFDRIRNAGLKCVIRFAYSDDEDAAQLDASKSRMLAHIQQLKPLLQANADVIAVMQAGFIGAWGEWYYTDQAEFGGHGYNNTSLTAANYSHRKDIINALMSALPERRMIQIRTPKMKQQMYSLTTPLPPAQAFTESSIARLGHHNDCFLASSTDMGTYSNTATEYPYLEQETRFLPMGGETCAVYESKTSCAAAQQEMSKFHWSFLNLDYHPSVIQGFKDNDCFTDIQKKLGYRFELVSGTFPQQVNGNILTVNLKFKNVGFAGPFNERKAYIVLKNTTTNATHSIALEADPRTWLPSNNITINENLTLPAGVTPGSYKLYLHLPDLDASIANRPDYAIRFANENMWDSATGYNNLNFVTTVSSTNLGIADNEKVSLKLYPVPTQSELTIEGDLVSEYAVSVYNTVGQRFSLPTKTENQKIIVSTQSLSDGIYFVLLEGQGVKESKNFIVKH